MKKLLKMAREALLVALLVQNLFQDLRTFCWAANRPALSDTPTLICFIWPSNGVAKSIPRSKFSQSAHFELHLSMPIALTAMLSTTAASANLEDLTTSLGFHRKVACPIIKQHFSTEIVAKAEGSVI